MPKQPTLLSIVEVGGYPDFSASYRAAGFDVLPANSMRKALSLLKTCEPGAVVAEFNFQSDFRDRTSSLESLLATLQSRHPQARVIVFYDQEHAAQYQRLAGRFRIDYALAFPIAVERLSQCLAEIQAAQSTIDEREA